MLRCAILDDYQNAAVVATDWSGLRDRVETEVFHAPLPDDAFAQMLRPFEIIVAMRERTVFDEARLRALPNLRLLVTTGMRNASIDMKAAARQGITVCGTGSLGNATPEHSWALLMALCRDIPAQEAALRGGHWQTSVGTDLAGKTLGLVGFGKIAKVMCRYAEAFDMPVIAWSRSLTEADAAEYGASCAASLSDLLGRADMVSVHVTLNAGSRGMIGANELAAMRPGAYLINTSRGPIVDTAALAAALKSGALGGAAVDVFDTEPVAMDNPLLAAPRTILTPHLGYVTQDNYVRYYSDAVEDILAWLNNAPLRVLNEEAK